MTMEIFPTSPEPDSTGPITKQMHTEAIEQLIRWGKIIEPNTLVLGFGEKGLPIGTSVPIEYKSEKILFSAAHVAECFETEKQVRTFFQCDRFDRHYPPKNTIGFKVEKWDPNFKSKILKIDILTTKPKDLAVIVPAPSILNEINSHKLFYRIPEEPLFPQNHPLITLGCIEAKTEDNILVGLSTTFGVISSSYHEFPDCDYIVCTVDTNTYEIRQLGKKPIPSFQGVSGSGLWAIIDGKPVLVGIAIAQDLDGYATKGEGTLYFHGPKSIYAALKAFESRQNTQG